MNPILTVMSTRRRCVSVLVVAFLALIGLFLLSKPPTPDGLYCRSEAIDAVGDWYEEFKGGNVYFVVWEDPKTVYRVYEGRYFQTNSQWLFVADRFPGSNSPVAISWTWAGITIGPGKEEEEFLRRRIIPRRRPKWMLGDIPWSIQ